MSDSIVIVPMTENDWPQVEQIYAAGIATGNATFETATPSWAEYDASRLLDHRLVAVGHEGHVLGWAACSPVSDRVVYAGVVEHSIYVRPDTQGRGVGSLLLAEFIASTEQAGIWTVQSSIFAENSASLRLHERHGFAVVGVRQRIGRATAGPFSGRWRDTMLIERRSAVAG